MNTMSEVKRGAYDKDIEGPPLKQSKCENDASTSTDAASCNESSNDVGRSVPAVHVPKTKYAIAFGYLGTNYHGFQIQSGVSVDTVDTVEARILDALLSAGAIYHEHWNTLGKLQLSKASRTDKGVHAACTYIGGRFELTHLATGEPAVSREPSLVAKLNELLPDDIRCFQIVRVTRGFCARSMCSKRMYEYVLPMWLLNRRYVLDTDFKRESFAELSKQMSDHIESRQHVSCSRPSNGEGLEGCTEERDFDRDLFESIVKAYCGSHDFKNFTQRQKVSDQTTQRFVHDVKVEKRSLSGVDAVSVVITGQSFLYNQIRKMLGLAYAVYLGTAPQCAIRFALSKWHTVHTPLAPAEGLFLHHPYFDAYNRRCSPPQTPFIEYDDVEPLVEEFKRTRVDELSKGEKSLGGPPYLTDYMTNPDNPVVFLDIQVGSHPIGRLKIELFADKVPRTAENFRQFCTGEFKHNSCSVGYKGTTFHKIVADCMVQGGDFVKGDGTGSLSIYGHSFADENFVLKHTRCGMLSMANTGPDSNGCQFNIVTKACDWMDGKNVVFGCLIDDDSTLVLRKIESVTVGDNYRPKLPVTIVQCGQL
ncbi:Peptidyl-prolyl cis-trans isomerase H [Babesia sp. Xinjiang]|uniref:Peptidyl-prolyl cis-trans isomerase H n=1 Tax=Babesia sp. Xinjiang TaxID=462227 RepID=UPI000A241C02|nr:Peptidyl-prolyl cis-trans isomerase H [Babesia sp. Xinjiang]ORM39375.1 Peptidyl-prolyl cis-trans isomerase H [Babesia sp. Xinjiang]